LETLTVDNSRSRVSHLGVQWIVSASNGATEW
jgi:hypothetical protein